MILYPNPKINLGLQVIRKREDGYHELQTLFVPYPGLKDVLEVVPAKEGTTRMFRYGIPYDGEPLDNICVKAWKLLEADFGIAPVDIHLYKNIPVGAGLGGGSADGTFTLAALNGIFSLNLTQEQLCSYAARLGSDCPFFVFNRPMTATGRGEILSPFEIDLEPYRIELVTPPVSISTAEAYRGIRPRGDAAIDITEILRLPVEKWKGRLENDFETTVFALHPELEEMKADLYGRGAVYASMSGSGSALYGIFKK